MLDITLFIGHNIGNKDALTTQDICSEVVHTLRVKSLTAMDAFGMWNGMPETSTQIRIMGVDEAEANRIASLVPVLASRLRQDAIHMDAKPSTSVCIPASIPALEVA